MGEKEEYVGKRELEQHTFRVTNDDYSIKKVVKLIKEKKFGKAWNKVESIVLNDDGSRDITYSLWRDSEQDKGELYKPVLRRGKIVSKSPLHLSEKKTTKAKRNFVKEKPKINAEKSKSEPIPRSEPIKEINTQINNESTPNSRKQAHLDKFFSRKESKREKDE